VGGTAIVSVTPIGVERDKRTFQTAASLGRLGHESIVVEGEASGLDRERLPFELITIPGAKPPPHPANGGAPSDSASGRVLAALKRALVRVARPLVLRRNFRRENRRTLEALPAADLYYLTHFLQAPAVWKACARHGAGYIYDANDAYWAWPAYQANPRSFRRLLDSVERRCVERAAAFVTVGDSVAGVIESRYGRRPEVIRNLHDLRIDEPSATNVREVVGVGEDDFLLVVPGNEKPSDATDEALRALAQLPGRVHLALIGRGYEQHLPRVRELGLESRVHLLPPVAPTEVTSAISSADAGLIDTRARDVHMHALPTRLFHCVAAGLPVLYPPLPDVETLAREHGLGLPIDAEDPDSVAAAARELAESPDLAASYRANIERAREVLNWEREERKLAELVEGALRDSG
jgi:glycosyltransferase involved in cell wall biosynthesis